MTLTDTAPLETRRTRGRLYIAGPMRGYAHYNFPAFASAASRLREYGYEVLSPAEMDQDVYGWDDHPTEQDLIRDGFDVEEALMRDFQAINRCDGVALLPGWRSSDGARREIVHARMQDRTIYEYRAQDDGSFWLKALKDSELPSPAPNPALAAVHCSRCEKAYPPDPLHPGYADVHPCVLPDGPAERPAWVERILHGSVNGETRIVDPTTGGAKGQKLERFDLLPWDALAVVASHYGKGASKYTDRNWELGYNWSLSFGALQRHLAAFWQGEDDDVDTTFGPSPHLAAAAFHVLALLAFYLRDAGTDNRPDTRHYDRNEAM